MPTMTLWSLLVTSLQAGPQPFRLHTTVALFSKHGCPNPHRKLSRVNDGQESLKTGQPSENGGSHVLETSHGEGVGLAEVEATRTAMQGAMDHPGLNALPMAELAGSGVASELAP